MIHVIQYHDLKIIPVDMYMNDNDSHGSPTIVVNIDRVKERMNSNTVAALVFHPLNWYV